MKLLKTHPDHTIPPIPTVSVELSPMDAAIVMASLGKMSTGSLLNALIGAWPTMARRLGLDLNTLVTEDLRKPLDEVYEGFKAALDVQANR